MFKGSFKPFQTVSDYVYEVVSNRSKPFQTMSQSSFKLLQAVSDYV
jgi:hypothetical protein